MRFPRFILFFLIGIFHACAATITPADNLQVTSNGTLSKKGSSTGFTVASGQTVTNNGTLSNAGTLSGAGVFNFGSGTVTLPATATVGAVTITWPGATGTVATLAGTESLTNKTISLSSNTLTATSAQLKTAVSDEVGSGALVFANTPTLITPEIGAATGTSLTGGASGLTINSGGVSQSITMQTPLKLDMSDSSRHPLIVYGLPRGDGTDYMTMLGGEVPGLRTNGYVTINGDSGDPVPLSIAGNSVYMLGINTDVGLNPVVVIKGDTGPFISFYDGADSNVATIGTGGTITASGAITASGGTNGDSSMIIGTGGGSPSATRFAILNINSPHSGSFTGTSGISLKRAGTEQWFLGLQNVASSGSVTANTDLAFYNGSVFVAALSTAGNLRTAGLIASNATPYSFSAEDSTQNGYRWYASANSLDQKYWFMQTGSAVGDGVWRFRLLNDALSNGANVMTVARSGITVGAITFGGTSHTFAGTVVSSSTTEATVGGAGAITTTGGVFATKAIVSDSDTSASSSTTGGIVQNGSNAATSVGIGGGNVNAGGTLVVGGTANITGVLTAANTTEATSSSAAGTVVSGGLAVAKSAVVTGHLANGIASTATAAGTTSLTAASKTVQIFTGATTQTVQLPAANALGSGIALHYVLINASSGDVTAQRAGSDLIVSGASSGDTTYVMAGGVGSSGYDFYSNGVDKWYVH